MATEKDITFAVYLLKLAQEGKLRWEATARPEEFTASLKGKYSIVVDKRGAGRFITAEGDPEYNLRLTDQREQELLRLTEDDYGDLPRLFEMARRTSLRVDEAIDEILREE